MRISSRSSLLEDRSSTVSRSFSVEVENVTGIGSAIVLGGSVAAQDPVEAIAPTIIPTNAVTTVTSKVLDNTTPVLVIPALALPKQSIRLSEYAGVS